MANMLQRYTRINQKLISTIKVQSPSRKSSLNHASRWHWYCIPPRKTNMEPKVFGWDGFSWFFRVNISGCWKTGSFSRGHFPQGSHFSWPLQLAGLTGLRPVARLQHGVPQAWRMRMKNGVGLEPVIIQMVPPAVAQMPSCHRANLLCRFECWPRKLGRFVLKILMRLETLWALMVNSTRATTSRCRHGLVVLKRFRCNFFHHRCLNEMVKQSVVAGGLDFSWWYQDTGHGLVWCLEIASRARIPKQETGRNGASKWSGIQNLGIKSSLLQRFRLKFPRLFAASLRPPECGWQDVKDLMRERGGSTDVWLVKVKGWNINKGGC